MDKPSDKYPSLRQLYPSLSSEELRIASENIDRYVRLILRICKRLESTEQPLCHDDLRA